MKADKRPITDLSILRPGQMLTQDYRKPTERSLRVENVSYDSTGDRVTVEFSTSRGDRIFVSDRNLPSYDIKAHVGTPMLGD